MSEPILSIVIPTYNRAVALAHLLEELTSIYEAHSEVLQIVVCDNKSTDDTASVVASFAPRFGGAFRHVTRRSNTGIEGNITGAMLEGDGKYVWVLSDHQRLQIANVIDAVERMKTMEFDIGHAKLLQWPYVLDRRNEVLSWRDMTGDQRGALLFTIGNISSLMFRRTLALKAAKAIFQACGWSYPNLGLISAFSDEMRVVEFHHLSALPESNEVAKFVIDYDKIGVCFRANIEVVRLMAARAGVTFNDRGFFGPTYRHAFRGSVMNLMRQRNVGGAFHIAKRLRPVIAANPWGLKLTALFVIAGFAFVPTTVRISLADSMRAMIRQRRQRAADSNV